MQYRKGKQRIIFLILLMLLLSGCRKGTEVTVHSDEPGFSVTESMKNTTEEK